MASCVGVLVVLAALALGAQGDRTRLDADWQLVSSEALQSVI